MTKVEIVNNFIVQKCTTTHYLFIKDYWNFLCYQYSLEYENAKVYRVVILLVTHKTV